MPARTESDADFGLAVDDDYVFAGSEGNTTNIYRIAKSDGAVMTLASGHGNNAKRPIVHGDDVYFATDDGVFKVPKRGGDVQRVSATKQTALTFAGETLYGCRYEGLGNSIDVVRIEAAGNVTPLTMAVACESLAANGQHVFFGAAYTLGRVNPDGSGSIVLGNYPSRRVILDGDEVYTISYADGEVRRIDGDNDAGTVNETVAKYNDSITELGDLTVDATHVYWTIGKDPGRVFRSPKSGGPPEPIADNLAYPCGIAVDEHSIYWSERNRDTLWTRTK